MSEQVAPERPLVVMYHYVRPDNEPVPAGIRPLLVSAFEAQLDWLGERYEIMHPDQFLSWMDEERSGGTPKPREGRPPCLLTFDDGTRDHAEVVTPILARRGLSGVFFALTWPALHHRMPLAHAIHWMLSGDERRVWEAFERFATDRLGDASRLGSPEDAMRFYAYESPLRARIKYAANMALPPDVTEQIVSSAITAGGRSSAGLADEWFASREQLRAMHDAGMVLGIHGASHRSLPVLGAAGIRSEIGECADFLTDVAGTPPTWFACPFGGGGAAPEATDAMQDALRRRGVRAAVTTEKCAVPVGCDPLRLPRLDAIDLPPLRDRPAVALS